MQDWLFASGGFRRLHDFNAGERIDFRHGAAKAYLEETMMLPGIWLYRAEASARSRFSIDVTGGDPDDGRVVIGTMLAGRGVVNLEGCGEQIWREDGRTYSISPITRHVRYDIDAIDGWRAITVRLEGRALDLLGADGCLPSVIRETLEGRRDDLAHGAPVSGALRAVSHLLLRSPYEGNMQHLFRQGKVLELLAHLFERFGGDEMGSGLASRELARVRLARDRLLADLRDPPDLEALSADVGLSPKRLNRGFRSVYGATVFNYLRDARLDAARAALAAGTPLSLKQLAWELGYGQVTNFVTAFRRRFGVPPGAYRSVSAPGDEDYAERH